MRKSLLCVLAPGTLVLLFCLGIPTYAENVEFLSKQQRVFINNSQEGIGSTLDPMLLSPRALPPEKRLGRKIITPIQKQRLLKYLLGAKQIDPQTRVKDCEFKPGASFSFYSEDKKDSLVVLVCFNCDLWALGTPSHAYLPPNDATVLSSFGDLRPHRGELELLTKEIFGDDFFSDQKE